MHWSPHRRRSDQSRVELGAIQFDSTTTRPLSHSICYTLAYGVHAHDVSFQRWRLPTVANPTCRQPRRRMTLSFLLSVLAKLPLNCR